MRTADMMGKVLFECRDEVPVAESYFGKETLASVLYGFCTSVTNAVKVGLVKTGGYSGADFVGGTPVGPHGFGATFGTRSGAKCPKIQGSLEVDVSAVEFSLELSVGPQDGGTPVTYKRKLAGDFSVDGIAEHIVGRIIVMQENMKK